MSGSLAEVLDHLVQGIVDNPNEVRVTSRHTSRGERLEVRVHPRDLGRVIGRRGRTAQALRTVIDALSSGRDVRIDVIETDLDDDDRETETGSISADD